MGSMEKYSSSLWPDWLRFHCVLTPYAQAACSAQDHQMQLKSALRNSFSIKTLQAWTPELELEDRQHFRKLGIQKQTRALQEVCSLSSPLNTGQGYKSKGELPVFKQGTFFTKEASSFDTPPLPTTKRLFSILYRKHNFIIFGSVGEGRGWDLELVEK